MQITRVGDENFHSTFSIQSQPLSAQLSSTELSSAQQSSEQNNVQRNKFNYIFAITFR